MKVFLYLKNSLGAFCGFLSKITRSWSAECRPPLHWTENGYCFLPGSEELIQKDKKLPSRENSHSKILCYIICKLINEYRLIISFHYHPFCILHVLLLLRNCMGIAC